MLRRGTRPFNHPRIPNVSYLITLTHVSSGVIELWPLKLQGTLSVIPVPLKEPDQEWIEARLTNKER